jgi:hypothetical protein
MARKTKSIKQTGKQNVIQTVKVVVAQPTRKRRGGGRRRQPTQMVETISAKTLAPVFIQPPVASQTYQYPFDTAPRAGSVTTEPIMKAAEVPKTLFEDLTPKAETFRPSARDVLADKEIVDVVPKAKVATPKMKTQPHGLPENPTTSVDSNFGIDETTGFGYDKNPTGDMDINSGFKQGMGMDIGVGSQDVVPNYEQTSLLPEDISEIASEPGYKQIMTKIKEATIDDLLNIPKGIDTTGWSRKQAKDWIRDTVRREQLTAEEFKRKYIQYSEKRKQTREIGKYKQAAFDEANRPKDTTNVANISMAPNPNTLVQTVTSSSNFV